MKSKLTLYDKDDLDVLAVHCIEAEVAATKVERRGKKSVAALLLESRNGERFDRSSRALLKATILN